ncbi:SLAM family member 9-like [Nerophis ophidion]|uniref:SLAM family member 9-like n=1 Tax=Nerophis ophidion TaxID=159077 RepID=UPI002ADFCC8C|nr:SLAM family member 9-like [Nerophis ophidion]
MVDILYHPYKNRITLDRVSAELIMKNATYEDSGVYSLYMNINQELHSRHYKIEVIDKVTKPNISCEMNDTKQAMLVCSAESRHPHLLNFKWNSGGKEQTGHRLTITVRNEDDDQVYHCEVSNPLTNETASFTAKDCFLDKISYVQQTIAIVSYIIILIITFSGYVMYLKSHCSKAKLKEKLKPEEHLNPESAVHNCADNEETKQKNEEDTAVATPTTTSKMKKYACMDTIAQLEDTGGNHQVYEENLTREDDLPNQATLINQQVEEIR